MNSSAKKAQVWGAVLVLCGGWAPGAPETSGRDGPRDCLRRGGDSAVVVYFGDDAGERCARDPEHDFGVTVAQFDRCVAAARTFHVPKYLREGTCRYVHDYIWTENDDPDYDDPAEAPIGDGGDEWHDDCTWVSYC